MDSLFLLFISCLFLGCVIGFMAGLLGIGGGIIAVPILLYLLPSVGFDVTVLPHVAIATSLAAIILTSLSSARAHHKQGNIPWPLLKSVLPGLILGSLSAGFISSLFSADLLQTSFAVFVICMAVQMIFPYGFSKADKPMPSTSILFAVSTVIAIIAALMGIGGGVLLIPFLSWCGLQMKSAIGFSSASGVFIALFGSASYVISGWNVSDLPEWTLGYVYLPALLGIVMTSVLIAPLGVKAASIWPTKVLKRIFALLLVVVGVKLAIT
ncbi:putative permease [Shewanella psychrophila]|uniref:Probable membrane transporter protein n=1 Tax=Shewanella psychrophila TaxID=225848 RepID=A0A1S6HQ33_9GAMM|nr:sulfite exporter TauE/SafE family protein [Shewanella psychrophila]AQS37602.1 putative permease [Shewanella psychrophila]